MNCLGGEHFSTKHANNIKDAGTKQVGSGSMSTIDHEFMVQAGGAKHLNDYNRVTLT